MEIQPQDTTEIIPQEEIVDNVVTTEEPKEETLRETLSKAYDKVEKSRDERGKFSKGETLKLKPETKTEVNLKPDAKPDITPQISSMPKSWAKEKSEVWGKLPKEAQDYISKREDDTEKLATRFDEDRNVGGAFKKIVDPYFPLMQQHGKNPFDVVQNLLHTQKELLTASPERKTALVKQLIKDYNVNMGTVDPSTPANANPSNPDLSSLMNRLQELDDQVKTLPQQLEQKTLRERVSSNLKQFESNTANIHYQKVKPIMAGLLESGVADGLQDAYDKAIRLDDSLAAEIALKKKQDDEASRLAQIKAKTEAAKRASAPIHGSPANTAAKTNGNDNRPLREVLSEAYDSIVENKL